MATNPQMQMPTQGDMPAMPSMKPMLITLVVMMVLMIFYQQIGKALNYVLDPILAFDGKYVVLTLVVTGIFMTTISTVIRAALSDTVSQTQNQREMSAFNAELRQARLENNLYKIKKLTNQQQQMMGKQMQGTSTMMKTMPITMIIIIPIYAWIRFFLQDPAGAAHIAGTTLINVPWGILDIGSGLWFIVVYTLISIPFGQLVARLVRAFQFRKRLRELDSDGPIEVL